MAETDTSPAALRALAAYWASEKPAGVDPDKPGTLDAALKETDAKMEETIAALQSLAGQKEALNSTLRFVWGAEIGDLVTKLAEAEMKLTALAAEKEAGAPAPAQGPLTEVGETSRGYKLYRAPNPVGGNTYWSDEIGGGVVVWDTCLVGEETLRLALSVETGTAAPAPDGWIPWEGGDPPVADLTRVDVRFRNGVEDPCYPAIFYHWTHDNSPDDIIAYRLSKEGTP